MMGPDTCPPQMLPFQVMDWLLIKKQQQFELLVDTTRVVGIHIGTPKTQEKQ